MKKSKDAWMIYIPLAMFTAWAVIFIAREIFKIAL